MTRLLPLLLVLAATASAQPRKNSAYIELGGSGGSYALGYERTVAPDVHARLGASYYYLLGSASLSTAWTPNVRLGRLRPELGAGVVAGFSGSRSLYSTGGERPVYDLKALPMMSFGARLAFGGSDLRAGVTALYGVRALEREVFRHPYLGFGVRF